MEKNFCKDMLGKTLEDSAASASDKACAHMDRLRTKYNDGVGFTFASIVA